MKAIRWIGLFVLTLFWQTIFSQNHNTHLIKSFFWQSEDPVAGWDSTNMATVLKNRLGILEDYEFVRKIIRGTKGKMSEKDDLGYVHERYAQYYKGIEIEHSDIRVRYFEGAFVSANGSFVDAPYIDVIITLSIEEAIQKAVAYIDAKTYMWEDETENNETKNSDSNKKMIFVLMRVL